MTKREDKLRDELISLRACQNAHNYSYDVDIECRIKAVQTELSRLARQRIRATAHRELMFDLNGHYGRA